MRLLLLFFVTFLGSHVFAQESSMQEYLNGTVSIRQGNEIGTGFIVSKFGDDYYIATANHVVAGNKQITIHYDQSNNTVQAEVVQHSDNQDIALIKAPIGSFDWQPKPYLIDNRPGDPVWFSIQRPGMRKILPIFGAADQIIASTNQNEIIVQLSGVDKGCSGGPLLGKQGIIGLIFEVRDDGKTISRPISQVWRLVKREWEERWDLPLAERIDARKTVAYGTEQSVRIVGAHASLSDGSTNRMIDGDINSYWQSQSARSDALSNKASITMLLNKPTLVTAIDVYVPDGTKGKYLNLVDEVQSMLVGSARATFSSGETRRILYQVKNVESNGKWYTCRFDTPTQLTKSVTLQLSPAITNCSDCLYRHNAYVHEVRVWGRPLEERGIGQEKVEQIPLANAAIRVNGNAYYGGFLRDGNVNQGVYLNLHENNQVTLPRIDIELPRTNAITHIRLFNPKDTHLGSVNIIQPYYDGIPGREIVFDGRHEWDQVALESGRQARSLSLLIKKAWDPVGNQQAIQLNEIQLLGHELVSYATNSAYKSYPLAGAQASSNTMNAYRMINGELNDGWTNDREENVQGSQFDLFVPQTARVEAVRIYNQENDVSLGEVTVVFANGGSERLVFRGIPGWEDVALQHPVQTDIVRFTIEGLNAPERKRGRFYIREIQLLGNDRVSVPAPGTPLKPQSVTASSQLNDHYWNPRLAFDNELNTAWAPANANSYEPWIRTDFNSDVVVSRFSVANQLDANPVTQLTMQFSDGTSEQHLLKGYNKIPEVVTLNRPHKTRWVKLIIEKWLPGNSEPLFRLSELTLYGN